MSPEIQAVLNDLRGRLERLEYDRASPRGRTNLAGAARYLGISDETLRQRHLRGEGTDYMLHLAVPSSVPISQTTKSRICGRPI